MGEYRYYEFLALDRRLSSREMRELRSISTRATITPTRFTNWYTFGDLKADSRALLGRYFDAHLFISDSGTRALSFRFPRCVLSVATARRYLGRAASTRCRGTHVVVDLCSTGEADDWSEESDGPGRLAPMLPVRDEVASGDLRALYLAWLLRLQEGELRPGALEPPVPPGLRSLTPALQTMVEFLRIDPDLLRVAAADSRERGMPTDRSVRNWVASLSQREVGTVLVGLLSDDPANRVQARRHALEAIVPAPTPPEPRTVASLLSDWEGPLRRGAIAIET